MNKKNKKSEFIKRLYYEVDLISNLNNTSIRDRISIIATQLKLKLYYFNYDSELNNLGNNWNIFINIDQKEQNIWQDFGMLIGTYYRCILNPTPERLVLHNHFEVDKTDTFPYYFCIPDFLLNNLTLPDNDAEATKLIAAQFHVDELFAENRLKLHRASK